MRKDKASSIATMLWRRNLSFDRGMSIKNVILDIDNAEQSVIDTLYEYLKKYSFRILLRDIVRFRDCFSPDMLTRFVERQAVENYLRILLDLDIISGIGDDTYVLRKLHIESFGDTLEWFVAQIFEREFRCTAGWGMKMHNKGVGGDYDVLASVENYLVYVEVKSSPPKHIDIQGVLEFVRRINALNPNMAVLLVDTALRMRDKIVPLCGQALRASGRNDPVECLESELFHWNHKLYIINAKPHLVGNLQKVVGDYLRHAGMRI